MDFSGSVPNNFSKENISEDFSTTSESIFFWISARFLFLGSIFPKIFLYFRRFWQWIFLDQCQNVPNNFSKKTISEDFSTTSESIFFWISARFLFLGSTFLKIFLYFRRFWQWIFLDQCQIIFPRKIFLRILALLLSQFFSGSAPDFYSWDQYF